jgi:four helix bundle protein
LQNDLNERRGAISYIFLDLAKGSCGEARSTFYLAEDLNYLASDRAALLRGEAEKLFSMFAAFANQMRS